MTAAALAARLRARGAALAARWVAMRVRRATADDQARFGRRDRLADPQAIWPGDEA
ncbi:MAG: hypothetical protein KGQ52_14735 [Alphaproteobacteria bacterium]|nr:hypothetical protein [Alphaproteobacteria bacterium]